MDAKQIETSLAKLFEEDGHRIVFWNDPDQSLLPSY